MLDIHNHILFGVDDGCEKLDETMEMINKAISVGVTDLIMTPHYSPLRGFIEETNIINRNFGIIKQEAFNSKLEINLYLGREIDCLKDISFLLENNIIHTMNNTRFILIDFGMEQTNVDEYCYELILKGYIPIIAHPERYYYIKTTGIYKKWKKTGALIQINASSVFRSKNKKTRKNAEFLLKNNLVDFIASDCHTDSSNYDELLKVNQYIKKKFEQNDRFLFTKLEGLDCIGIRNIRE